MNKRNILIVGGIILGVVLVSRVTFSYLLAGGKQELANTFNSGCLSITIENESAALDLKGAYPISDVEGLGGSSYDFTIKNNCSEKTTYSISLESLEERENNLAPEYIKVALASDTMDNLISKLSDNPRSSGTIENAYASYNLYNGEIEGEGTKTFQLREWIDYDTTKEQGADKVYKSVINVSADTRVTEIMPAEIKFDIEGTKVTGNITGSATNAKYCTSTLNKCKPEREESVEENKLTFNVEGNKKTQIVCSSLDDGKVICSNPICIPDGLGKDYILACRGQEESETSFTGVDTEEHKNKYGKSNLYIAKDDFGETYYFRGKVDDNWVKFGDDATGKDIWWRIIRINGDGSIRMIYAGISKEDGSAPETIGTGTRITVNGQDTFYYSTQDGQYDDNAYVGYYYKLGEKRGLETKSYAAENLDEWFRENLNDEFKNGEGSIDKDAGFCNDRSSSTEYPAWEIGMSESGGTGQDLTYYGVWLRMLPGGTVGTDWGTTQYPTFNCSTTAGRSLDYFTYAGAISGTQNLTYPVGLITADEVVYAGGFGGQNNRNYYLYTGQNYWTMSPSYFSVGARVFRVTTGAALTLRTVYDLDGLRPVINLKSNLQITGVGTTTNPYQISN